MTHLTLVPDPAPARERRKPWKPRRRVKRHGRNLKYQHTYEDLMILRDIRALGGNASMRSLCDAWPGRYHERYLLTALKRLQRAGHISRDGRYSPYIYKVEPTILDHILSIARTIGVAA